MVSICARFRRYRTVVDLKSREYDFLYLAHRWLKTILGPQHRLSWLLVYLLAGAPLD